MHGAPIDHAMIGTPLINGKDVSKTYLLDRDMHKTPLKVTCASGLYLTLENGQKILDATGGAAVACLGHGNKEVQQAIHDQMEEVSYCHSLFFSTTSTDALARNLIEGTDHKMAKAFIVSSGSEAMEAAMKLSRQYFLELSIPEPSRINYIARDMSYHGSTLGALSMSGHLGRRAIYKPMLLSNIHRVSSCNPYRQKTHHDTMEAFVTRKVAELDAKFQELGPETVIAFVCEPIVGAALGCVPAAPGYLRAMKSICDKYGALFIMDEIMCGMGRSGTLHAWQQEDVVPDIQTIGKGLGGGYAPVAGILIGPRVVDTLAKGTGSFMHGQTYQAHPISCAAAFAVQNIIQKDDLLANVRFTGQRLEELLHQRLSNHPYVGDIRGRGLFWGIEFVNDKDTKEPFDPKLGISKRIHDTGMREPFSMSIYPGQGSADGIRGDHVILSPAYNVTLEEVNEIVSRFVAVVRKVFEDLDDTTLCGVFQAPKLTSSPPIFYLAYGSNLSPTQMSLRCPSSTYIGIARLPHYRWIINERGYANVVTSAPSLTTNIMGLRDENEKGVRDEDEVWGLVYELDVEDEERLNGYEGVPWAYQKKTLEADIWLVKETQLAGEGAGADRTGDSETQNTRLPKPGTGSKSKVLVYIDTLRTTSGIPRDEYVLRMRRGIREGIKKGLPRAWVESVIGKYIPLDERVEEGVVRM